MKGIAYDAFSRMADEAIQVSNEAKEKNASKNIGAEIGRVREFAEEHDIPKERADKIVEDTIDELKEHASVEDRDLSAPNEQGHANDPQMPKKVMSTPGSMLMQYLDDSVQFNTDVPNDHGVGQITTLEDGTQVKVIGMTQTPVVVPVDAEGNQIDPGAVAAAPAVDDPAAGVDAPVEEPPIEEEVLDDDLPVEEPPVDEAGVDVTEPQEAAEVEEAIEEVEEVVDEPVVDDDKSVEQQAKEPPVEEEDEPVEGEEPETTDEPAAVDISEDDAK